MERVPLTSGGGVVTLRVRTVSCGSARVLLADHRRLGRVQWQLRIEPLRLREHGSQWHFTAVGLPLLALALNFSGTRIMALIAQIGLVAELTGVVALGLFLMIFRRKSSSSVLFDPMGAGGGDRPYLYAFLAASLNGLFLFYGFEAVATSRRRSPTRADGSRMRLTTFVGGISAVVSFIGYLLTAPDLRAIVAGEVADPIPAILAGALGETGARWFLIVAMVSFVSCVLSLQAAAIRLIYSFAPDRNDPSERVVVQGLGSALGSDPGAPRRLRHADRPEGLGVRQSRHPRADHRLRRAGHLPRVPGRGLRRLAHASSRLAAGR